MKILASENLVVHGISFKFSATKYPIAMANYIVST